MVNIEQKEPAKTWDSDVEHTSMWDTRVEGGDLLRFFFLWFWYWFWLWVVDLGTKKREGVREVVKRRWEDREQRQVVGEERAVNQQAAAATAIRKE